MRKKEEKVQKLNVHIEIVIFDERKGTNEEKKKQKNNGVSEKDNYI